MIWFILKLMMTRGLAMKRWNNFPRIEDVSHIDNVWYTIHIALFLSYLEEKKWNKIDKEFLIKRIIFNSFITLLTSDINSGTREYIKELDSSMFDEIERLWIETILSFDWPDYLKDDIKTTLLNNSKTLELDIISASKKYAWLMECKVNSKIFDDVYEVPLEQINTFLYEKRKTLKSLDTLLSNENYKRYLSNIRRLSHSMRWSGQTRIFPISVMSHLVVITFISYVLGMVENQSWEDYDITELLLRTIYHDIPEAITWDVITPTKKAVAWFDKLLEEVENKMMDDYMFSYIDADYKKEVYKYMLTPFDWKMWALWKHADIFSALIEAKVERIYWWKNYDDIYVNIKKKLNSLNTVSMDYMLKIVIDNFDEAVDDLHLITKN